MGAVKSCCSKPTDDKLMVTKMDLSHCGCLEVPHIVFNAERCIETLILASNQITSLPPQLFHCQEMKHLNLNDNCLISIPPAIGSFVHLVSLKLDKNNLQELPDNLKMCKKLKRLSLNNNPWKQMPNIVTQLITLEELYMNDCELNYLPASVGRLSKLKIMELRNNNLCNLPLSMTRLELLTRLDISDNELVQFPPCIPKLKSLKELLLDNNDIEEIIDLKNLVHLEHLDASYNHITNVSETIGSCTHLNMLNLSFNYIEQLPNSIGNITHLQTLQLEMNELIEIPKSIGKLIFLEELNLCNNKLCSLPNTIGLLRNLRNLNVSRNIIEEFPPEIGSCSKLGIINAAYNRLRVLPSEIGYLNNLKVLDLVGNFLMYLPITIINLRGVRAIWLSANQNVPLIPFTEDLNIASGERFLTNIALPQLGEIPLFNGDAQDCKIVNHEKSSSWSKKISFAEDEDILPGKLHRTPTPFPKELRSPNRKHQKLEEARPNDNYVNVIDGKVSEQEALLQPPPVPVAKNIAGIQNFSDGNVTRIREANIRRSNKDVTFEMFPQNFNGNAATYPESDYSPEEAKEYVAGENGGCDAEHQRTETPLEKEAPSQLAHPKPVNCHPGASEIYKNVPSPRLPHPIREMDPEEGRELSRNEFCSPLGTRGSTKVDEHLSENVDNFNRQQIIYSNLVNGTNQRELTDEKPQENWGMNPQRIREMYHNDVIYGSNSNPGSNHFDSRSPSRPEHQGTVEHQPKYLYSNSTPCRDMGFRRVPSNHGNQEECRRIFSTPPPPPPPPPPLPPLPQSSSKESPSTNGKTTESTPPTNESVSSDSERPSSKQDFISLAEQMKNRNIAPPCYEIAKMYSTKAALFENKRVDQLKTN